MEQEYTEEEYYHVQVKNPMSAIWGTWSTRNSLQECLKVYNDLKYDGRLWRVVHEKRLKVITPQVIA